jgi:hypothetical protein
LVTTQTQRLRNGTSKRGGSKVAGPGISWEMEDRSFIYAKSVENIPSCMCSVFHPLVNIVTFIVHYEDEVLILACGGVRDQLMVFTMYKILNLLVSLEPP